MKLIKLTLSNFKGVKSFVFEPNGNNASVYGTNASGKTTLFDALTWLLFDKGSTGEPGFSPKTIGADGKELHNINNRVDGIFRLDNGQLITFSKDQSENWVKKRGNSSEDFAGNTTDYYIDGVPVKKTEYEARIADICPSDKVQILTQPLYFPRILDWRTRRKILLEVCGDITDKDVINSSDEMKQLFRFLLKPGTEDQYYTVEECTKIAVARGKEIRKRLDEIPSRIDEATKALLDDAGIDADVIKGVVALLQADLDKAIAEKASITEDSATAALRQQAAELRAKIAEGKSAFLQSRDSRLSVARSRVGALDNQHREAIFKKANLEETRGRLQNELEGMQNLREELVAEYKRTESLQWNGEAVCPVCGQALPAEQIEASKAKFNSQKSMKFENCRHRLGSECSKMMISAHEDAIAEATKQIAILEEQSKELIAALADANAEVDLIESEKYEDTPEYAEFSAEIARIEAKLTEGGTDTSALKNTAQAKIDRINCELEKNHRLLMIYQANEQQRKRIADLEAEEKKLQAESEDTEYCLHLCEEFIKTKVSMLDERINAKFHNVRFRLFENQINGGIKECCDVMIPSDSGLVPFSGANNAAKLNAGLEIIDTLSEFWGVQMPVFVDNAESVVRLNPISPQVIRLVVSESDPVLRTEAEK